MKFAYPDMQAVSVDGLRLYGTPQDNYYPSITTVLGHTQSEEKKQSLAEWQRSVGIEQAEQIVQQAAADGTAVHLLAERFLNNQQLVMPGEEFSKSVLGMFNALKTKFKKIDEVWGQEVALYSDRLQVAGRCDLVAVYRGQPCIVDFKTSRSFKDSERIVDYKLQLCAYAEFHNEMFGTEISTGVILMTSCGGFPQEFTVNLKEWTGALEQRVAQFYENLAHVA